MGDFWDRFPDLRFSLTEGDIGWIPYFVWRAEHVQDRHSGWTQAHVPRRRRPPRSVFQRAHPRAASSTTPSACELLDDFNIDNVCWESDYPHSDGTWPNAPEGSRSCSRTCSTTSIDKITHENAMRHYQFDPFAHRPKEQCTVAALRAESPDVDVVTHVGKKVEVDEARKLMSVLRPQPKAAAG